MNTDPPHSDLPEEWPHARGEISRRFGVIHHRQEDLDRGLMTVNERVTDQGDRSDVQFSALRQMIQAIQEAFTKDVARQGRHHDTLMDRLDKTDMRNEIRTAVLMVTLLIFGVPFLYWLATK